MSQELQARKCALCLMETSVLIYHIIRVWVQAFLMELVTSGWGFWKTHLLGNRRIYRNYNVVLYCFVSLFLSSSVFLLFDLKLSHFYCAPRYSGSGCRRVSVGTSIWNVERVWASKASAQSQYCCLHIPLIMYQLIDTRLELRFVFLSHVWQEVYLIPRFLLRTNSKALKLYCIP